MIWLHERVWSLTAPFVFRKLAPGNTDRQRSMIPGSLTNAEFSFASQAAAIFSLPAGSEKEQAAEAQLQVRRAVVQADACTAPEQ